MRKINLDKAELLGLLCSDGYSLDKMIYKLELDRRRGKHYLRFKRRRIIEFSNKN